jgi:nicotinamidase-related amidase
MTEMAYPQGQTALLSVETSNDFLFVGGKMWPALSEVSRSVDLHANLAKIRITVHDAGHPIFILPNHRHRARDFDGWAHLTPFEAAAHENQMFAAGCKGGDWYEGFGPDHGDVVVKEHWGASSFANTDLNLRLRQRGITHVVFVGAIAKTCTEASARYAAELGYHVTLVHNATAAFSPQALNAAHEINCPTYADAFLITAEVVTRLAAYDAT